MPVPGYDPEDIDERLEAALTDAEVRERLSVAATVISLVLFERYWVELA